jgi:excinuclease ABC subunit C
VPNHAKRKCLYNHLGLCPCPPTFTTKEEEDSYRKTLRHLIDFLDGNTKKVVGELEKERDAFAKKEAFEHASGVQKQLNAISLITQPVTSAFDYVTNPNLRSDVRRQEMEELQKILNEHGVQLELPRRIECYDNSNIQGTNPTSSMVVLTNGEMDKSQYRKFKVRKVKGSNDFATMQEVLTRRFNHPEWPFPNLIIVDGGKGQVSSARRALEMSNAKYQISNVPIIGLAKRYETIITSDMQEIHLLKSSPALKLIMRIRDEAHRFAITYHRKFRSRSAFVL